MRALGFILIVLVSIIMYVFVISPKLHNTGNSDIRVGLNDNSMSQTVSFEDLRLVILKFEDGGRSEYIIHASELDCFIEASKQLHYIPGINPHNNNEAKKIVCICVGKPDQARAYWWSTPGLHVGSDSENGAEIYDFSHYEIVWKPQA